MHLSALLQWVHQSIVYTGWQRRTNFCRCTVRKCKTRYESVSETPYQIFGKNSTWKVLFVSVISIGYSCRSLKKLLISHSANRKQTLTQPNPGPNYPSNELKLTAGPIATWTSIWAFQEWVSIDPEVALCVERFKKKPQPTLAIEIQVTKANVGVYKRGYKDLSVTYIHIYMYLCSILYTCTVCVTSSTNWVCAQQWIYQPGQLLPILFITMGTGDAGNVCKKVRICR